jgi:hypothetical protein
MNVSVVVRWWSESILDLGGGLGGLDNGLIWLDSVTCLSY